ncbi:TPA: DUF417 family protein [Enterobacter roggenkampii]|uniref:DUF417 family protein n=1 Tax=Gammaproteobacteria TaxID=1236 RepID=UPI0015B41B17|nr:MULTISPECIES: DUF417 family protein [Citrobacter]EGC5570445.1 DUF417 family protein [Escherichia coli]ELC6605762.1 DUF417 family protein [Enterobacter hormaechei]CAF3170885.1 hypothetical protein AI2983V1_4554 [Enterobacter cloacae]HCR1860720.1 DUF417 family protein [Enterobacter kobei]HCR2156622.1 DUF417 family protein [Enterobacter asburiae]HDT6030413.1 DUF417 family protein [Enterobacter cloacae subsp. cloacae]HEO8921149.1 DUF417 family protein [Enterobacter hormaechei subsp. steigerwa
MKLKAYSALLPLHERDIVRIAVIVLFLVSGNLKWFAPEMQLVDRLTEDSWLSFLPVWFGQDGTSYFLAVIQAAIAVALLSGTVFPVLGVTGGVAAIAASFITLNLLPSAMDVNVIGLTLRELLLAGAAVVIVYFDLVRLRHRQA